jgi:hypothetical protein
VLKDFNEFGPVAGDEGGLLEGVEGALVARIAGEALALQVQIRRHTPSWAKCCSRPLALIVRGGPGLDLGWNDFDAFFRGLSAKGARP